VLCVATLGSSGSAFGQDMPLVPDGLRLGEIAQKAIDSEFLTDQERRALRLFHGVWDDRDLVTTVDRATVALAAWDVAAAIFDDPAVPTIMRAEAKFRAGEIDAALELIEDEDSMAAARLRAEAFEIKGDVVAAERAVEAPIRSLRGGFDDAADLTNGVRALIVQGRLRGQPARDFQRMLDLYGQAHQQMDRLYWPALLAEAELLLAKDHAREAVEALHAVLQLNPRCSEAWYALGGVAIDRFDFGSAEVAAAALERQNPSHPLAALLRARSQLVQDDPDGAIEELDLLILHLPRMLDAHALRAAARAIQYDDDAFAAALARCDELAPGNAAPYYVVGRVLSMNRQYDAAAAILEEAARRAPTWPAPQIELGLMELQSGRDIRALEALRAVAELDPFNKRAANSLFLLEELSTYVRLESQHFVVRYKPGVDEVMATMMPEVLERIHARVSGRFDFAPDRKTVIELMPDHERFSVRITGMPWIHTVAACTGPVIAMEVPREGKPSEHLGLFDWPRVVQHEYTHTITLAQTQNRIPHWLTEAAAVSLEDAPRAYGTCRMLAEALAAGTLFDLDEIKWAFVRPKQQGDRSKAYAQGHWMVEYMNERFGDSALIRLLGRYFEGEREAEAIPAALGVTREAFFSDFLAWAEIQVEEWGLGPSPSLLELTDELRWADEELAAIMRASQQARLDTIVRAVTEQIGQPATSRIRPIRAADWPALVRPPVDISNQQLAEWRRMYPTHSDLLELDVRRREASGADAATLMPLLEEYAIARPVDPYPHKRLADMWLDSETPDRAIQHLEALDSIEEKTPVYAVKLARLYRSVDDLDRAMEKATRALYINPYHAANRELAAALAIETGDFAAARGHIKALTLLEPSRPQHEKRLRAIERLLNEEG
jgi:tetratricopeptide (TPR) repeat protein